VGRPPLAFASFLLAAAVLFPASAAGYASFDNGASSWIRVRAPQARSHLIAYVRPGDTVAVRGRPFGSVLEQAGSTTPFGSPRTLAVVRRSGRWLGVTQPELGNGRLGWVDAQAGALRYATTRLELDVDLSARTMELLRGSAVLRRVPVGIGRPGSPTPTGRFAVTDKLDGAAYSPYYGCCILALSATQPDLPAGWTGGNRIAIHGTPSPSDFGRAVSAGCVHAPDATLRYLMRVVPLGTPVVIRP
jgi:L,D-transpeptidase catalytic domain